MRLEGDGGVCTKEAQQTETVWAPDQVLTEEQISEKRMQSHLRMLSLQHHVFICNGGCCAKAGSDQVIQTFRDEVAARDLTGRVRVGVTAECLGRCSDSCSVVVYPAGIWYRGITPESARAIIDQHLIGGERLENHVTYVYESGKFNRSPSYPMDFLPAVPDIKPGTANQVTKKG